jgi:hypothetical protein
MSLEFAMEAHILIVLHIPAFLRANNLTWRTAVISSALQNSPLAQLIEKSFRFLRNYVLQSVFTEYSGVAIRRCVSVVFITLATLGFTTHASAALIIDYVYDDLNRLTGAARNEGTPMVLYKYDELSNIKWIANANSPDTDGDDIPNFVDPDDDNDGIGDNAEIAAGLNPLLASDASGDLDGDGISNIDEYVLGSDIDHFHGDIDSDGDLDLGDIVILKRIIFEQLAATEEQGESGHGDVNIDGNLDVGDLVILRRLYFGN